MEPPSILRPTAARSTVDRSVVAAAAPENPPQEI
jgi:hypothetical protein